MFDSIKRAAIPGMLAEELPQFAAWLRDWEIPEHVVGSERYGVKSYHHPMLLAESRASSSIHSFLEFIEEFLLQYKQDHPKEAHWTGSALQLLLAFQNDAKLAGSVRMFISNSRQMGKMLASLSVLEGSRIQRLLHYNGITQWKIGLPSEI
jgi:hypothetical protein